MSSDTTTPLAENILAVLKNARADEVWIVDDDGKYNKQVGPLDLEDFSALSSWCRAVGLDDDADAVDAAVAVAPE